MSFITPLGENDRMPDMQVKTRLEDGFENIREGRYESARDLFQQVLVLRPNNAAAHFGLGVSLRYLGDKLAAINSLMAATHLADDDFRLRKHTAIALLALGKPDYAIKVLTSSISPFPYRLALAAVNAFVTWGGIEKHPTLNRLVPLFDELCHALNIPVSDKERNLSALSNFLNPEVIWKERALIRASDNEFSKWVDQSGFERLLERADAPRKGILLNSHMTAGRMVIVALSRLKLPITTLEAADRYGVLQAKELANLELHLLKKTEASLLSEALIAKKALESGRFMHLAGDGYMGKNEIVRPFLGRLRPFKTGFAELAIMTNTPVFPVFGIMHPDGRFSVEILEALERPASHLPKDQQIRLMIDEYVRLLEMRWKSYPGNIAWRHIQNYLEAPVAP